MRMNSFLQRDGIHHHLIVVRPKPWINFIPTFEHDGQYWKARIIIINIIIMLKSPYQYHHHVEKSSDTGQQYPNITQAWNATPEKYATHETSQFPSFLQNDPSESS